MKIAREGMKGVVVILGGILALNVVALIVSADVPEQNIPMVDPNVAGHHAGDIPVLDKDGL